MLELTLVLGEQLLRKGGIFSRLYSEDSLGNDGAFPQAVNIQGNLQLSSGEVNGNSLQYSCLENPMYRGDSQSQKNAMCLETYYKLVAVQSLSAVRLSVTPWTVAHQPSLPLIIS